jgi:hypothetical protein
LVEDQHALLRRLLLVKQVSMLFKPIALSLPSKACGEGLMPDALAALQRIGVDLVSTQSAAFRGIRFLDDKLEAEASFPLGSLGLGGWPTCPCHPMLCPSSC